MRSMDWAETSGFLQAGTRTAKVATVSAQVDRTSPRSGSSSTAATWSSRRPAEVSRPATSTTTLGWR